VIGRGARHGGRGGRVAALLADFRIGGPETTFLMAFANVGLAGDSGVSWSLPRIVGHARALELLLLAEPVGAGGRTGSACSPGCRRRRAGAAGRAGAGRAAGRRADGGVRRDQAGVVRRRRGTLSDALAARPRRRPSAAPRPITATR
jgi:2-(1,2-epoxy-1,2-dihydrophenyl)acetyl-CoA isomerase